LKFKCADVEIHSNPTSITTIVGDFGAGSPIQVSLNGATHTRFPRLHPAPDAIG
jgi:hypothetical protein